MPETPPANPSPTPAEVRKELARMLSSAHFAGAHRLSRFLRFVVERYLDGGAAARIRESMLALEVFDRGGDFDPAIDPIVRVEATRLRSKLQRYFRTEGRGDPVIIWLKKGSYTPVIRHRKAPARRRSAAKQTLTAAVLPFHNLTGDPALDFLCDGIAEELIRALSNVEGLRVIAWNSTRKLRGAALDLRFVAEQLNAGAVVEGSVRSVSGRLRIAAQLVETAGHCCLWSGVFEPGEGDFAALREEIARAIVAALPLDRVDRNERPLPARQPESPELHNLYLKGKYHLNRRTPEGLAKALEYFERLTARQPGYARGQAGLAETLVLRAWYGHAAPNQVMPRAKAAALKAVKAGPRLPETHLALGLVRELYDWDWPRARQDLKLAVDLEPGNATALFEYGFFLSRMGELDEAFATMRRARELDPLSPVINTNLGVNYYYQRSFEQAVRQYQEALEIDPGYPPAHYRLALAYLHLGMAEEAQKALEIGLRLPGARPSLLALSGYALARSGRKDRARGILEALAASSSDRYISPVSIAIVCLGMNDAAQALDWLENAREEHDVLLVDLKIDPLFDPLRPKPGFRALLRRLNLEQA